MRLLSFKEDPGTGYLRIWQEFHGGETKPAYAILSHRWDSDADEVSFQDFHDDKDRVKPGWIKVEKTCRQALSDGLQFAWMDTCCIDKRSSAELTEALNSMYAWYEKAEICYAYLKDVDSEEDPSYYAAGFRSSEWFARGWTLQELLAPQEITFLASDWKEIGTKSSLMALLHAVTDISEEVLRHGPDCAKSIAEKMSWAARRTTTRVEDRAYSLLGLFKINMPALYGEGDRAFGRLQYEIMRMTNDHSIFAFGNLSSAWRSRYRSIGRIPILATSPDEFESAGDIGHGDVADTGEFTVTHFGIRMRLPLHSLVKAVGLHVLNPIRWLMEDLHNELKNYQTWDEGRFFLAALTCSITKDKTRLCLLLYQDENMRFSRIALKGRIVFPIPYQNVESFSPRDVHIARDVPDRSRDFVPIRPDPFRRLATKNLVTVTTWSGLTVVGATVPQRVAEVRVKDTNKLFKSANVAVQRDAGIILCLDEKMKEPFFLVYGVNEWTLWVDILTDTQAAADSMKSHASLHATLAKFLSTIQDSERAAWVKRKVNDKQFIVASARQTTVFDRYRFVFAYHVKLLKY